MNESTKIFIIACEASGDEHAAHLVHELKKKDPSLVIEGLGGPLLKNEGVSIIHDMTTISALGFGDVIRQYGTYRQIFYKALGRILEWQPKAVIFVDSPAFNLRIAKKLKRQAPHIKTLYYICPQVWAWGKGRLRTIRKTIHKLFAIFPFEVPFFQDAGIDCEFVGHPLLKKVETQVNKATAKQTLGMNERELAIGISPGSREKEVKRILPTMIKSAQILHQRMPKTRFYVTKSKNISDELYNTYCPQNKIPIQYVSENFKEHLNAFDFALVTSGTATLQTALAETPFFLLYKTSWSTYWLARQLVKVPHLGIVNLLGQKEIVPEFLQGDAKPEVIAEKAHILLNSPNLYQHMQHEFLKIREMLGRRGGGCGYAAKAILKSITRQEDPSQSQTPKSAHSFS